MYGLKELECWDLKHSLDFLDFLSTHFTVIGGTIYRLAPLGRDQSWDNLVHEGTGIQNEDTSPPPLLQVPSATNLCNDFW